MEIVLISDGSLPLESPIRKLPFFYPARLVEMSRVSPETVGEAGVAVVEMMGSTEPGLKALRAAWGSIAQIPVICLVDKASFREKTQAAALGKTSLMDRDTPMAVMVRTLRNLLQADVASPLPPSTPEPTAKAFNKGSSFLESLCLSAVLGKKVHCKLMNDAADELLAALSLDGLSAWLGAVQSHHSATYCHSLVVAGLAGTFARHIGLDDAACRRMIAGGLVHDIGKMRIPLTILDKAGKLSTAERAAIDQHPNFGREILKSRVEVSPEIRRMAVQHHEYLDGSGYPEGLKGDQISTDVRMITICDIFAALTEARAYKEAMSDRDAIAAMREMGPQLDQTLVERFADMLPERDLGALSRKLSPAKRGAAA